METKEYKNPKPVPSGKGVRITDIGERMWPHLDDKARKLLNTGINNSVIQFDRGKDDGKMYQLKPIWHKDSQTRPEQKYERVIREFLSLSKVIKVEENTKEVPDKWVRRFALLIDKLAEADKLSYGVLGPPISMPLAKLDEEDQRFLLCIYVFSDFKKKELNKWLGNKAFVDEGDIGSDDWEGLPK